MGAPAICIRLVSVLKNKCKGFYDLSSLSTVIVGGSTISAEVHQIIQKELGCRVLQVYGITEAGFICGPLPPKQSPLGSMGTLEPGVEMRVS